MRCSTELTPQLPYILSTQYLFSIRTQLHVLTPDRGLSQTFPVHPHCTFGFTTSFWQLYLPPDPPHQQVVISWKLYFSLHLSPSSYRHKLGDMVINLVTSTLMNYLMFEHGVGSQTVTTTGVPQKTLQGFRSTETLQHCYTCEG